MEATYHYPPELFQLLVEVIPRLNRSKRDTLLFFRGAGTPERLLADVSARVDQNAEGITKFEIVRTLLAGLNEGGDPLLRTRREVVKRVAEFEDFSRCWPNDQMEARGLVSQVQHIVNVKDSFTRMNLERRREQDEHRDHRRAAAEQRAADIAKRQQIKDALFALFGEADAHRRGKELESVLNDLFALDGMLVREAFTLRGHAGQGVIEQIDGVILLDEHLYLVEMKWWHSPLGPGDVAPHLVRLYNRSDVRGIFISYTNFTPAALEACRDALHQRVVTLAMLHEIVGVLNTGEDISKIFRTKISAAMIERRPYVPFTPAT